MRDGAASALGSGDPHDAEPPLDPALAALLELTEELSGADGDGDVARIVATTGVARLGASAGFVAVPAADGTSLQMLSHVRPGMPVTRLCRLGDHEQLPAVEAWRFGIPILVHDAEELHRRYPAMDRTRARREALAALPLEVDGVRLGVVNLTFATPQAFGPPQRQALRVLATLCAGALRRAQLARDVELVRRDFAITASHELRSPLTAVYGAAMALATDMAIPAAARRQLVDIIVSESERMTRVIDDLQLTTEIDSRDFACTLAPVDLRRDVLDDILAAWERRPLDHGRVGIELPDHLPLVQGDAARLQQLVSHLVDNACRYSPARSPVRVVVGTEGDQVLLRVLDTGAGLDERARAHAFEKFYRGDAMQRSGVSGAGLGLYISHGIAEAIGGRLWLEPRADGPGLAACLLLAVAGTTA